MKKKEISTRNYITAFLISVFTIILTFSIANYCKNWLDYKNENVMSSFLSEIKLEEFNNFIIENHDIMIYTVDEKNTESSDLQKKVKKIITKNNFTKDIVVLDISDYKNETENLKQYMDPQVLQTDITENCLLILKNGKIVQIYQVDNDAKNLKRYIMDNFYGVE